MPQTTKAISQVPHSPDGPVAEDMLLGIGSVHAGQTGKANVPLDKSDMHQGLLDIDAEIMRSNLKPFQQHSGNETGQRSTHPRQDNAQLAAAFLITGSTSFDINEVSADLHGPPGKLSMTESHELQSNLRKKEALDAESGKDARTDKDAEKWSIMADGSQNSNK